MLLRRDRLSGRHRHLTRTLERGSCGAFSMSRKRKAQVKNIYESWAIDDPWHPFICLPSPSHETFISFPCQRWRICRPPPNMEAYRIGGHTAKSPKGNKGDPKARQASGCSVKPALPYVEEEVRQRFSLGRGSVTWSRCYPSIHVKGQYTLFSHATLPNQAHAHS